MIEIIIILSLTFIIGTFLGSFFGVVVDRLYREEQFVSGTSYCEHCKHQLFFKDMIPVVSFLLLKGKCRYCKNPLPISLPIIELSTGILLSTIFYISFVNFNNEMIFSLSHLFNFLYLFIIFSLLEIIFFMDAKYMAIPMVPLIMIGLVFIIYLIANGSFLVNIDYRFYGALSMFIFFAGIHFFTKGKMMGDGDIYLATLLGFMLGLDLAILMWFIAFIFGAFYGIFLMLLKKANLKQQVPFGPFILFGFVLSYSIGGLILSSYYSLFIG